MIQIATSTGGRLPARVRTPQVGPADQTPSGRPPAAPFLGSFPVGRVGDHPVPRTYLLPVGTAAAVFPFVAVLRLVPFSLVAYRRRGRLGWQRSLVLLAFAYSAVAAFLLTLMPLPRD